MGDSETKMVSKGAEVKGALRIMMLRRVLWNPSWTRHQMMQRLLKAHSGSPRVDAFPGGFPTAVPTKPAVYQRWAETYVPQMGW